MQHLYVYSFVDSRLESHKCTVSVTCAHKKANCVPTRVYLFFLRLESDQMNRVDLKT